MKIASVLNLSANLILQNPQSPPPAAPAVSASAPTPATAAPEQTEKRVPLPNTLMDGTPIKLRLGRTISSATEKTGNEVDFETLEEIEVNNILVIPKGSLVIATITDAQPKRRMGRAGTLDVNVVSVRLADGEKAALTATAGGKAGSHVGVMTGAIVATSIVFFPAAPLFLFMKGKDLTIPQGTEVTAYVSGDFKIDPAKFVPVDVAVSAASTAQISVDANVANCDIDVDGAFVGNTPSQLSVAPGSHQIGVSKKGYQQWAKTVMVSGSGVHIQAELEAEKPAPAASAPAVPQ